MKTILAFPLMLVLLLSACVPPTTSTPIIPTWPIPTPAIFSEPTPNLLAPTATGAPSSDPFTANQITLPAPACDGDPTPADMEGPYYKPGSPEKQSLLEPGMQGMRLLLVGYVLDSDCQPLSNTWIDFWQANANGEYDNAGFTLRGHQYTDAQGRYFLETVLPGLYNSRPIEHIHVKLLLPNGQPFVTQLYFPGQPVAGQTVELEERGDHLVGVYNFLLP